MANDLQGNQLVQNGIGTPYGADARSGLIYSVMTASAFAPVAAVPTTTAALEIWNASTVYEYEVLDLFAFQLLSTAATQTYSIWAQISQPVVAGPSITALTVFSANGGSSYSAAAGSPRLRTGVGTTVVANGWRVWGSVQSWGTAAATPGNGWSAEVNGKLVIPPQCSLCVTVAGSIATASSFHCGATVLERQINGNSALVG